MNPPAKTPPEKPAVIRLPPTTMPRKRAYMRAKGSKPLAAWMYEQCDKAAGLQTRGRIVIPNRWRRASNEAMTTNERSERGIETETNRRGLWRWQDRPDGSYDLFFDGEPYAWFRNFSTALQWVKNHNN